MKLFEYLKLIFKKPKAEDLIDEAIEECESAIFELDELRSRVSFIKKDLKKIKK